MEVTSPTKLPSARWVPPAVNLHFSCYETVQIRIYTLVSTDRILFLQTRMGGRPRRVPQPAPACRGVCPLRPGLTQRLSAHSSLSSHIFPGPFRASWRGGKNKI